jgi:subtilisin-like proprotein convertase family protein
MIVPKLLQVITLSSALLCLETLEVRAVNFVGPGGAIPDSPGSFTSQILVADNFKICDVTVSLLGLTHTFVGDLHATLSHFPTGTSVDLFRNIGEDGSSLQCNDFDPNYSRAADLSGNYSFNDTFTGDLWTTTVSTGPDGTIPQGQYRPTTATGGLSFLSSFQGELATGTWQLLIHDAEGVDIGNFSRWQLTLAEVPESSTLLGLSLLASAGLFKKMTN